MVQRSNQHFPTWGPAGHAGKTGSAGKVATFTADDDDTPQASAPQARKGGTSVERWDRIPLRPFMKNIFFVACGVYGVYRRSWKSFVQWSWARYVVILAHNSSGTAGQQCKADIIWVHFSTWCCAIWGPKAGNAGKTGSAGKVATFTMDDDDAPEASAPQACKGGTSVERWDRIP